MIRDVAETVLTLAVIAAACTGAALLEWASTRVEARS